MTLARRSPDTSALGVGPVDPRSLGPRELLVMISSIMALMALAIDMLLPAFDEIRNAFDLPPESTQISQVITFFFLGLAVAQLVWGPLADRFGRKKILYAGIAVYVIGAIGSALAPSMAWLLFGRFVWGVGAAGARVVATAIIRDSFEGTQMAKAMSQIMAVFVMAPVFAPSLGAGLQSLFGWRSIFWFCVLWSVIIGLWTLRLPETLRAEDRRDLQFVAIRSGFGQVLRHRVTSGYTTATMFLQGAFAAYLGSSERLIDEVFGRGDQFPLIFGVVAIMFAAAAVVNGQVVGIFGMKRLIHLGLGAVLTLSLVLVAMSMASNGEPNFWLFIPLLGFMLALFMFLMPNLNTSALEPMGRLAGTASSVTGAARVAGGAVLGAIIDSQVQFSTTPFAVGMTLLAVGAIVSVVIAERAPAASESEPVAVV